MAGKIGVVSTTEVALAAATAKTIVQLIAPTNYSLKIKEWGVYFDGISTTAEPVQVRLLKQTTAGTMSSLTPALRKGSAAVQSTAQHTATVEPTAAAVMAVREVHPQSGYQEKFAFGDEIELLSAERIGIECTAPAIVNVRGEIVFEE